MEFQAKDRKILLNALRDAPEFQTVRERQALVRMTLEGHPFSSQIDNVLKFLNWEGSPLVVADELVRRLEGHELAPGLPAMRALAEAIEPIAGMAHREELNGLRRRLGWLAAPSTGPSDVEQPITAEPVTKVFDVFLCHNSQDRPAVLRIAEMLLKQGIQPWLDIWELRPGMRWQPVVERQIDTIKAAAVFVGNSGFGPWHDEEVYAILSRFQKQQRPVIPVILEDAVDPIQLPAFLDTRTRVDFRLKEPDPLNQLVFGIKGQNPRFA